MTPCRKEGRKKESPPCLGLEGDNTKTISQPEVIKETIYIPVASSKRGEFQFHGRVSHFENRQCQKSSSVISTCSRVNQSSQLPVFKY